MNDNHVKMIYEYKERRDAELLQKTQQLEQAEAQAAYWKTQTGNIHLAFNQMFKEC